MGLDDILLLSYPCGESQPTGGAGVRGAGPLSCLQWRRPSSCLSSIPTAKAPHFSRLGDVEVNAGQNASFQCMAAGRAAEAERFLLQVRGGVGISQGWRVSFEAWLPFQVLRPSFTLQQACTCMPAFPGCAVFLGLSSLQNSWNPEYPCVVGTGK
jgi:hypothetical protein